jgi:hypothetical protein
MRTDYPTHWLHGQLLDMKRFTDGSFRATLLGEEYDTDKPNAMEFASASEAQAFVSWWYSPPILRDQVVS